MEMALQNGFLEISNEEMQEIDGGSILGTTLAVIAIGKFTVEVTVGGALTAIGTAYAAGQVINEIYNAFQ